MCVNYSSYIICVICMYTIFINYCNGMEHVLILIDHIIITVLSIIIIE